MNTFTGKLLIAWCCILSLSVCAQETVLFHQDFESELPGMKPKGIQMHRFGRTITDRFEVSGERSVSGDRALYFRRQDSKIGWQAQLRFNPKIQATGRLALSFHYLYTGRKTSSFHRVIIRKTGVPELLNLYMSSGTLSVFYRPTRKKLTFPDITFAPGGWYRIAISLPLTQEGGHTLQVEVTDLEKKKSQTQQANWTSFTPNARYSIFWDFYRSMRQTELFLDDIKLTVSNLSDEKRRSVKEAKRE